MPDHVTVVVYVTAEEGRTLRENGITDVAAWVRSVVKNSVKGIKEEK